MRGSKRFKILADCAGAFSLGFEHVRQPFDFATSSGNQNLAMLARAIGRNSEVPHVSGCLTPDA